MHAFGKHHNRLILQNTFEPSCRCKSRTTSSISCVQYAVNNALTTRTERFAMSDFDWQELMQQWNQAAFADTTCAPFISRQAHTTRWLGYPGATDVEIVAAELRLDTHLPPSYRSFLRYTNGWQMLNGVIWQLWSTSTLDWHAARSQDLIDEWIQAGTDAAANYGREPLWAPDEEYFVYGADQTPGSMRDVYLQTALEVSDLGDSAFLLLNPRTITAEGEWEAWFFATWLPGAIRYRSFWELMQGEYQRFLALQNQ
jgi:hypothetical protein